MSCRVTAARALIEQLQISLLDRDSQGELGSVEKEVARKFNMLAKMDESMMRPKAMIYWLELGNQNTSYFFSMMKRQHNRNVIISLSHEDRVVLTYLVEVKAEVVLSVRSFRLQHV